MGLLSFMTGKAKPFDSEAAQARVRQLEAALPTGTQIELMEPEKGMELTYYIQTVSDRSQSSALLAAVVEVVKAGEERWSVDLSVHAADDDDAPYSSFALPSYALPALDVLLKAHDDLYPAIPTQTILLDASDGSFTICDVPRDQALATAQVAVRWWASVLGGGGTRWGDSSLSVDVGIGIGADGAHAEILYGATIERDVDTSNRDSHADWAARVFAAWEDNLPALEAMLRLPVPPDHEVEFSFTDDSLKPRLSVAHHETHEEDKAAAKELVAAIRGQVPGSKLKVG